MGLAFLWLACIGCATSGAEGQVAKAASAAAGIETEGWLEIRVRDFSVLGNAPHDELRAFARELALFASIVERITTAAPGGRDIPVRIYVFATRAEADLFTGWAGGILLHVLPGYVAITTSENRDFVTRQILFHEYVHYALRKNRRTPYPLWYDEGMSEYLGSVRFRDDAVLVGAAPPERLTSLRRLEPLPLATLIGAPTLEGVNVSRYYATAWGFVHLLNSSSDRRARLHDLVSRLVRGEDWQSATAASFDASLEALELELAGHVDDLDRGVNFDYLVRGPSLQSEEYWGEAPVAPAEIAYQLGTIARLMAESGDDTADSELALALFEQAVRLDESHPQALAARAWSLAAVGRFDEAQGWLQRAQVAAPEDPVVVLETGRIMALLAEKSGDAGDRTAACQTLERAVGLAPEAPEGHAELARCTMAAEWEPTHSIAAFERARELGAWSPSLDLDLAREYLRAGQPARAESLLVPVSVSAHGSETSDEAQRLLDSLRSTADGAASKN